MSEAVHQLANNRAVGVAEVIVDRGGDVGHTLGVLKVLHDEHEVLTPVQAGSEAQVMLADDVAAENFIPQHAVIKAVAQALQAAQELGTLHRIGAFAQIADGSGRAQHLGIRRQHQIALIFLGAANELFQ